jgi:hypothetical protein
MRDEATCRNGELGGKRMSVSGKAQPTDARIRPTTDIRYMDPTVDEDSVIHAGVNFA